jgi:hypothetical protein
MLKVFRYHIYSIGMARSTVPICIMMRGASFFNLCFIKIAHGLVKEPARGQGLTAFSAGLPDRQAAVSAAGLETAFSVSDRNCPPTTHVSLLWACLPFCPNARW